jgi:hypothetical protein
VWRKEKKTLLLDEICTLLGCYTAYGDNPLLTLRQNLSVLSSRVKTSKIYRPLKMGMIGCPEMSVKELPPHAAQYPKRVQISFNSRGKPEVTHNFLLISACQLTRLSRVLYESLRMTRYYLLVRNTKSYASTRQPLTGPNPEPDESSPYHYIPFLVN